MGIYGVISYGVGQRTQEIGVRMAMGAARTSVVGLVLRGGMTWAVGGIAVGLFGAWAVSRAIASLLFDISAADPLTFGQPRWPWREWPGWRVRCRPFARHASTRSLRCAATETAPGLAVRIRPR